MMYIESDILLKKVYKMKAKISSWKKIDKNEDVKNILLL